MRVILACTECAQIDGPNAKLSYAEYRDDNRYEFTCERGHTSVMALQQQRFEVLFDIGAHAILDGYYREAVSSFTSSLERFYEFFVRAALGQSGVAKEGLEKAWKEVAAQSERQLGAFLFVYLLTQKQVPLVLSQDKVKFRNDVIHKGKIPSRGEAIEYGQAVLDVIRPHMALARKELEEGVRRTILDHLIRSRTAADANRSMGTQLSATILNLSAGPVEGDQRPLTELLVQIQRSRGPSELGVAIGLLRQLLDNLARAPQERD